MNCMNRNHTARRIIRNYQNRKRITASTSIVGSFRGYHHKSSLSSLLLSSSSSSSSSLSLVSPSQQQQHQAAYNNQHHYHNRWFHNCSVLCNADNNKIKTTMANRKRFYKHVGVVEVSPPWMSDSSDNKNKQQQQEKHVESPISAGVDNTQSASGVERQSILLRLADDAKQRREIQRLVSFAKPGGGGVGVPNDNNNDSAESNNNKRCWYGVALDGRLLKTPLGQPLAVPSRTLAWAIAAEWDSQSTSIKPTQMPLMTLSCTALDQTLNNADTYRAMALQYLPTDTTCYYADPGEDYLLLKRQQKLWTPLHNWISERLHCKEPAVAMGTNEALLLSLQNRQRRKQQQAMNGSSIGGGESGTVGLPHPPCLVAACTDLTHSLDIWHLTALALAASEAKSFLIALHLVLQPYDGTSKNNDAASLPQAAIDASRIEEEFQIENWGLVEGGHDYDRLNCSIQLRSISFLLSALAGDDNNS